MAALKLRTLFGLCLHGFTARPCVFDAFSVLLQQHHHFFSTTMKKTILATLLLLLCAFPLSLSVGFAASQRSNTVTVAVFSINDFHSAFLSNPHREVPGAAYVVQTLDSLKSEYPYHLTLSAGDNFGGSFFYTATKQAGLIPQAFADMGIRISTLGNHEFDDGQPALAAKWAGTEHRPNSFRLDYVCANVRNEQGEIPAYVKPWEIVKIALPSGRTIDVAIVGLLTSNTPNQASKRNLKGLSFDGRYDAVIDSIARLAGYEEVRKAPVRLLLTHIGCQMQEGVVRWEDPDAAHLMKIDKRDFHGIFAAHSHDLVMGMSPGENGLPVLQGMSNGRYVSMFKCEIDTLENKLVGIVPELVRVNPRAALSYKSARLQAQIEEQYHTTLFRGMPLSSRLTYSEKSWQHSRSANQEPTKMGTLVCESYAAAYRQVAGLGDDALVVGVSHFGSIRAGFPEGVITVLNVGEALPFANALRAYRYTGRRLMALMEHGINVCKLGRIQTSGVEVTQDKKGRVRSLRLMLPSGKTVPIRPNTELIVVADDYMTTGGDGYLPSQFPVEALQQKPLPTSTDAFIAYLKTIDVIR